MTAWRSLNLGECCQVFSGNAFQSALFTDSEDAIALVKGENVSQGRILWDIAKRWPIDAAVGLDRYRLHTDDVVLAMDRPWIPAGLKFSKIRASDPESLLVQRVARLRAFDGFSQRFLFYVIADAAFAEYIKSACRGVTVPHISASQICAYRLRVPRLAEQERIARFLSSYDDLIDNNCRRMALLERAARELYHEWFIRLRFPGHERVRRVDGLPEGWEHRPLGACAKFQSGGTPSKARADFWDGDIPWVSSGELTEFRIRRTSLSVSPEGVADGSRMVPAETILAVVRGMSLAKEFRIGLTSIPMSFNQDLKAIVATADVDTLMLFHSLDAQRDQIRDKAGEASHGTKKLDTAVLSEVQITVPPFSVQQAFRSYVQPMHAQWDILEQQNVKLRVARDLLLPRLMNGSITP